MAIPTSAQVELRGRLTKSGIQVDCYPSTVRGLLVELQSATAAAAASSQWSSVILGPSSAARLRHTFEIPESTKTFYFKARHPTQAGYSAGPFTGILSAQPKRFAPQQPELVPDLRFSAVHNIQASILPVPTDPTIILYDSKGPATGRMWGTLKRLSNYTFRMPDGSSVVIPATNAYSRPAAPTLSQVAGGALAGRTRWVRVFYLKFVQRSGGAVWIIYRTSPESSFVLSANNLLTVTAPATVAGYDRWGLMVGATSNNEVFQRSTVDAVPFGTNWTEPVGGADIATGSPYDAAMDSGLTIEGLQASTTYKCYVFFDRTVDAPVGGAFRIGVTTGGGFPTAVDDAAAADQNADGMIAMSFGSTVDLVVPIATGTNSGTGAGSPKYR